MAKAHANRRGEQRRKDFRGKAQGEDNIAEHKALRTRYVRCHRQDRIVCRGGVARLERASTAEKQARKFGKADLKDEVRRREDKQRTEELQELLRIAAGKPAQQPQHDPAREQRENEPLPGKAREQRLRRCAPIGGPAVRKERAGRGKNAMSTSSASSRLQLPPRPDVHERIERQQDHRGIQRERQREAKASRGGQRTQTLPHCAAGESGDRKGVALEKAHRASASSAQMSASAKSKVLIRSRFISHLRIIVLR